jgi:hypothetical protein
MHRSKIYLYLALIALTAACSPRGPLALFRQLSPHDNYAEKLKSAGLDQTAMGTDWLNAAVNSYFRPVDITLPYRETGYFGSAQVRASALRFTAKHGQQLRIAISLRPAESFALFADLLQVQDDQQLKVVASADSAARPIHFEVKKTGSYVLRLQPELLKGGEYTLTITTGPSLKFPVAISGHPRMESFWGDSRDNGGRHHEGIDIFAPKGTPALAAFNGTVTRVTENKLGGLVVFMRPDKADYTLYYAHLGQQLVHDGQQVLAGDTVGLIDNTGNAKTTPSHLHFGIYAGEGAVDPLPFVDRTVAEPPAIGLPLQTLGDTLRISKKAPDLQAGEPVIVRAISAERYLVVATDGREVMLSPKSTVRLNAIEKIKLKMVKPLYDRPDTTAARQSLLKPGEPIQVLAGYRDFKLVRSAGLTGWISLR